METNGIVDMYVIFDAIGSTSSTWMSMSRVVASSFTDLYPTQTHNYFSLEGYLSF